MPRTYVLLTGHRFQSILQLNDAVLYLMKIAYYFIPSSDYKKLCVQDFPYYFSL
jgi:hypothetical protein